MQGAQVAAEGFERRITVLRTECGGLLQDLPQVTGAGAAGLEAAAVHVGRSFFQTVGGRVVLALLAAAAVGGGVLGYGWARDQFNMGNVQPTTEPIQILHSTELPSDSDEDLILDSTEAPETVNPDSAEDLTEPGTEPTEPSTEPTEPGTVPPEPDTSEAPTPKDTEPQPAVPNQPQPQPTEPEPTEPEPTEPSIAPTEPATPKEAARIAYFDTDERIENGSWCYYHVNLVGSAVPALYTDHPELLSIEYMGTYTGGNLQSGETGHFWMITALDVGTASLYCTINGETQTVGTVTVPLPAVDWNPNMPPVSDVIIDFEEETEP